MIIIGAGPGQAAKLVAGENQSHLGEYAIGEIYPVVILAVGSDNQVVRRQNTGVDINRPENKIIHPVGEISLDSGADIFYLRQAVPGDQLFERKESAIERFWT